MAAVAALGTFFDLFDIFLAGVLGTVLTEQFHLDRTSLPMVLGSGFLGMAVGALGFGPFADRLGRRRAFLTTITWYSAFTLAGAFADGPSTLIFTRFMAGIGIGAEPPLVDAYLSELLPTRERGRYMAIAFTFAFLGVPAAGLLARVLVPTAPFGVAGWRWMFVIGALGAVLVGWLRRHLPESPRWLESVGRGAEAEAIVAALEAESAGAPAAPLPDPADLRPPPAGFRHRMAVLCVLNVFQPFGYYGFGTLVPLVLASKGFSVVHSLTYTSAVFLGYPLGSALSIPIVERVERRTLMVAAALLMSIFGLALGVSTTPSVIIAFGFAYTAASNVFGNAFHIFQGELFETSVRATAAGLAYSLSRLSSAAMPFLLVPLLQRGDASAMFAAIAAAMLVVIVDVGLFAPRTTGRALEEIA